MTPKTKLSQFMSKMGWTTAALAKAMRRPVPTVKGWRTGRRVPWGIDTREKLAATLGLTMRQLTRLLDGDERE